MKDTTKDAAALRAGIEKARMEIERSVADLRAEVHETLDWRRLVRRHPAAFFCGALAVGLFLARATSRSS